MLKMLVCTSSLDPVVWGVRIQLPLVDVRIVKGDHNPYLIPGIKLKTIRRLCVIVSDRTPGEDAKEGLFG